MSRRLKIAPIGVKSKRRINQKNIEKDYTNKITFRIIIIIIIIICLV